MGRGLIRKGPSGCRPPLPPPPLQGKGTLLVLEKEALELLDADGQTLLHRQPIAAIRVWGVGRDSGRWVWVCGLGAGTGP